MSKKFTTFAFAAAALMAMAVAQAGTAAAPAATKTEPSKPVTAAAAPALGEKATSIFCAKKGHEDGYPPAVANEIRDAIKAEEVKGGGTTAQAIDRIYASKCGPDFTRKG